MLQTRGQYKARSAPSAISRSFKQDDIHLMGMEFIYPEWSFTEYFSKFNLFKALCNIRSLQSNIEASKSYEVVGNKWESNNYIP